MIWLGLAVYSGEALLRGWRLRINTAD
jgi:hypothetical protein